MRLGGSVGCAVLLAALACGGDDEANGLGALELEGDATRGAQLFELRCEVCHGENGAGGSQGIDLGEHVRHHSDRELVRLMANGAGRMPSPGLSDQEIADVLAFLRATFP